MNIWEYIKAKARLKEESIRLNVERQKQRHMSEEVMCELADFVKSKYGKFTACTVLMYFYTPEALGGYKMCKQMRNKIANALKCNPSYISKKRNVALFLYDNDRKFHKEMDDAIEKSIDFINNIID